MRDKDDAVFLNTRAHQRRRHKFQRANCIARARSRRNCYGDLAIKRRRGANRALCFRLVNLLLVWPAEWLPCTPIHCRSDRTRALRSAQPVPRPGSRKQVGGPLPPAEPPWARRASDFARPEPKWRLRVSLPPWQRWEDVAHEQCPLARMRRRLAWPRSLPPSADAAADPTPPQRTTLSYLGPPRP
jgi:hypothetical protein